MCLETCKAEAPVHCAQAGFSRRATPNSATTPVFTSHMMWICYADFAESYHKRSNKEPADLARGLSMGDRDVDKTRLSLYYNKYINLVNQFSQH